MRLRWWLSGIRCTIYGAIVGWGVWKAGTSGYDSISQMTPLQLGDLIGDALVAFGGVLLAFLDNSLQALSNGRNPSPPTPPPESGLQK
jgi:hypothetical protein